MKAQNCVVLFALIFALLLSCWGCQSNNPTTESTTESSSQTEPSTTEIPLPESFADYTYRYEDSRDREWEEDIVYLAETFLEKHPLICNTSYFEQRNYGDYSDGHLVNDNLFFNEDLRKMFIREFVLLLDNIPAMDDVQIHFELQRIVALLNDGHSKVIWEWADFFPIMVHKLENAGEMAFYTLRIPNEHAELIYTKLTAINGIEINEIVDRLRAYVAGENSYWEEHLIWDSYYDSLLIQKDTLRVIGVLDKDADTAEFTFSREDGSTTVISLTAIPYEAYDAANMRLEDFRTKQIGCEKYRSQKYYWYEVLPDDGILYMRINRCYEMSGYSFDSFCRDVTDELVASEEPLKLVIDLRTNMGGKYPLSGFMEFLDRLQSIETNGMYAIINHGVFSSGIGIVGRLVDQLPDIQLLGTPTGQPVNQWGNARSYDTPNGLLSFNISKEYWMFAESIESEAIMPDILMYQTLEDYKQDVDTVLEYIKDIKK